MRGSFEQSSDDQRPTEASVHAPAFLVKSLHSYWDLVAHNLRLSSSLAASSAASLFGLPLLEQVHGPFPTMIHLIIHITA